MPLGLRLQKEAFVTIFLCVMKLTWLRKGGIVPGLMIMVYSRRSQRPQSQN